MKQSVEEMAEEYADLCVSDAYYAPLKAGFLAGYQAAKDTYKEAISAYEDVAKQMLEEAVRIMSPNDQVADADKVMCSTTMEEIKAVDTGELMPITNLPTSAKWISVKDRLPEIPENDQSARVLLLRADRFIVIARIEKCVRFVRPLEEALIVETDNGDPIEEFTHWMPLPAPPKEEKLITSLDQIHRPQKRISVEEAREMFPDKPPKEEK